MDAVPRSLVTPAVGDPEEGGAYRHAPAVDVVAGREERVDRVLAVLIEEFPAGPHHLDRRIEHREPRLAVEPVHVQRDLGLYLQYLQHQPEARETDGEEEQLRFSLVMKNGKIITDHSSIEPDFVALNGNFPKAYESEFEMSN